VSKSNRSRRRHLPRNGPLERFADVPEPAAFRKLQRGIRELRERGRCDFCGDPPREFGIFLAGPTLNRLLLAPRGSTVTVPYALCSACFARPGAMDRYEQGLWGYAAFIPGRTDLN
jgi:hypothetical protein